MKKTFPLVPAILTLAAFGILCSLGVWQIQRLQWKERMLSDLHAAYETGALPILSAEDLRGMAGSAMVFARGRVMGRYENEKEMLVGPRTWRGRPGYHVLTPLMLSRGGAVLVNRGWISNEEKGSEKLAQSRINGFVTVTGLFRRPETPNIFVPANHPATGTWHSIDLKDMLAVRGGDYAVPLILYAEEESGGGNLPVREALRWEPQNRHLSYALFWFSMAGVLLVISYLRFFRRT